MAVGGGRLLKSCLEQAKHCLQALAPLALVIQKNVEVSADDQVSPAQPTLIVDQL